MRNLTKNDIENIKKFRKSKISIKNQITTSSPMKFKNEEIIISEEKSQKSSCSFSDNLEQDSDLNSSEDEFSIKLDKAEINKKYESIVDKFLKNHAFDFIITLFHKILPIIISLKKIFNISESFLIEKTNEFNQNLEDFANALINFLKNQLSNEDLDNFSLKNLEEFKLAFNKMNLEFFSLSNNEEDEESQDGEDEEFEIGENNYNEFIQEFELPLHNLILNGNN